MKPESSMESTSNNNHIAEKSKLKSTPIIDISTANPTMEWHAKMHIPYQYDSATLLIAGVHHHQKEIILGICAALIVFLFILTVFCASRRNDDYNEKLNSVNVRHNNNNDSSSSRSINNNDEVFLNEIITVGTNVVEHITIVKH